MVRAPMTPGPWVIGPKCLNFDFAVVAPAGDAELGTWLVAGVRWEGNARLIAAAPDLLAACERGLARIESDIESTNSKTVEGDILRAALAKAKGQQ